MAGDCSLYVGIGAIGKSTTEQQSGVFALLLSWLRHWSVWMSCSTSSYSFSVSPAWSVFHPGVKLHQDKDLIGWEEVEVIWRVCDHISLSWSVWSCAVVTEPERELVTFPFMLCMFRLFRFLHIIKLDFCVANYLVMKIL